jgi:type III restriction enzyme
LKAALKDGTLKLPDAFEPQRAQIAEVLRKASGRLEIKNADDRKQVAIRKSVLVSPEFKALWDRVKQRTTYRVAFDNDKLVADCISALQKAPPITPARLQWRKADIAIGKAGVTATETAGAAIVVLDESSVELPDLLTDLQDRTQLTRRSIAHILTRSGRLDDFKRNPQQFIEVVSQSINHCKRLALVDGIQYQRLGADDYWAQELFEDPKNVLMGYLNEKNARMNASKSVYEHVIVDSAVEWEFADQLEKNDAIKLYAKLPSWFKVPTPLGTYNPDWAVLVQQEEGERLYFVVETKGTLFTDALRDSEAAKINCGRAHFAALTAQEPAAKYVVARTVGDVLGCR